LQSWQQNAGDVLAKIDHINPTFWRGNAFVKNVILMTSWQEGQRMAEQELTKADWIPSFKGMEKDGTHDVFCPFRGNKMVLIHGLMDGEWDKDQNEQDVHAEVTGQDKPENPIFDVDLLLEPDVEDLAAGELVPTKYEAYLIVDEASGGNTPQHKSHISRTTHVLMNLVEALP
jgi:hypothetical protein